MGLYLLNISVDTADPYPVYIAEDLSFNDQESVIELVVEKFLGYENAIEEYDDGDTEDHNKNPKVKIELVVPFPFDPDNSPSSYETKKQEFPASKTFLKSGFHQLDTPPPKL